VQVERQSPILPQLATTAVFSQVTDDCSATAEEARFGKMSTTVPLVKVHLSTIKYGEIDVSKAAFSEYFESCHTELLRAQFTCARGVCDDVLATARNSHVNVCISARGNPFVKIALAPFRSNSAAIGDKIDRILSNMLFADDKHIRYISILATFIHPVTLNFDPRP